MGSARWRGSAAVVAMLFACSVASQEPATSEVDWRSRAQVGIEVLYEWESREDSSSPQGGGTAFVQHGTLLDRVYAKEGDDFLVVRVITNTNGTNSRTELRFFHLLPGGAIVDDGPLESFCWENASDDFPHRDPIGVLAELVPGLARERRVEILDPRFREVFPDPVTVQETVTVAIPRWMSERYQDPADLQQVVENFSRFQPEAMHATLARSWKAPDEQGLASANGEVSLLSLEDKSTFEPATGVLLERELEFSYVRKGDTMIQTKRRTMREVSRGVAPFPDTLASSAFALREAYRLASTEPREACRLLTEWSRDAKAGYRSLEDVAPQIWLIASRAEREHSRALGMVFRRSGATSTALPDDDTFEALRRGHLSALFTQLGLDGARHRSAYQTSLERRGLDRAAVSLLMGLHDEWNPLIGGTIPEPQRSQGSALLETELRELGGKR